MVYSKIYTVTREGILSRRFFLLFVIIFGYIGVYSQDTFELARNAYNEARYKDAKELLLPLANKGDAKAQTMLGRTYLKLKDVKSSIIWLKKVSSKNDTEALYLLGQIYEGHYDGGKELGIPDETTAKKYYEKAFQSDPNSEEGIAAFGNLCCIRYEKGDKNEKENVKESLQEKAKQTNYYYLMRLLGHFYQEEKDDANSFKWFRRAAEQNDAYSQMMIGRDYMNGNGNIPKDNMEAIKWLEKAVESGDLLPGPEERTRRHLGWIYKELYDNSLDNACLKKSAMWFYSAKGDIFCDNELYKMYEEGLLNAKDYGNYEEWEKYVVSKISMISDVDKDIPRNNGINEKTFVLIIANEKYEYESEVPFAVNDGDVFKKYCLQTLNILPENIHLINNATTNKIKYELDWLTQKAKAQNGTKILLYYSGHGIPSENGKSSYLLPSDGFAKDVSTGIDIAYVYDKIGKTNINSIVLLDACFSGAKRSDGMLVAARSVAIKAKDAKPQGKMVVLSACQNTERAFPFAEQKHGLFTYYLLKKLKESKGRCNLDELYDFVHSKVNSESLTINQVTQTPSVSVSEAMGEKWKEMKLQ